MNKEYDLFISYADADRPWVEGYLLDALTQAEVRYLSETAFRLGSPRIEEFQRAVQQSQRTLLVLSPAYLADSFNQFVDLLSQTYGEETQTWPVIPLILQPVQLPPRLAMLVQLKAVTPEEQETAIARLCADLKLAVPTTSPKPPCPYPGMKPFTEAMRDRFFGREQEIEEMLECLRLHPFLTVVGPSGSGKSSLVFAGLIPALRQTGFFGAGEWIVRSMRPGATPLTTLKEALGDDPTTAKTITQVLSTQPDAQRILLVIDQFEEIFTQVSQESIPFQQALLALTEIPNVYLVLTARADFYSDLMTSLLWRKIQAHRLEVVPLDEIGLRQAILKPAEDVGVFIEPALLERLVIDARGEPGVLPLLQETLVLLWERLERRFLPLRAYEALILPRKAYGVSGSAHRTGLQVAISHRADDALATLEVEPEQQRAIARRIFLRLVQFGEGRADTRRQQPINALQAVGDDPALFNKTLYHLVDRRLLTLSGEVTSNDIKVDMAHEALIGGWSTLQQWILERREAEQTRRRLTAKAEEWVRLGEGAGGLLDKIELDEAERWLSSPDAHDLGYDATLPKLIAASRRMVFQTQAKRSIRFGFLLVSLSTVLGVLFLLVLPWSAIFLNNRGFEKFSQGQDESALQDFNLALMLNPSFADALYNRGLLYQQRQNLDLARMNYQAAVDRHYTPAYGQLARLEIIQAQNYPKAVALAREGLQLAPDEDARYILLKNLGWAQLKLKEYPPAEVALKQAIAINPQRGSAYCLLAQTLESEREIPAAREQWKKCLEVGSPTHPDERVWIKTAKSKLSKKGV